MKFFEKLLKVLNPVDYSLFEKAHFNQALPCRLLRPQTIEEGKKYPLVLLLHGSGERGSDNEKQLRHGASYFLDEKRRNENPCFVLVPQCPDDEAWCNIQEKGNGRFEFPFSDQPREPMRLVLNLLDELLKNEPIDTEQLSVIGISMGGMGLFDLLLRRPSMFKNAVAICGGGNPELVHRYATGTSFQLFHGSKDSVVAPSHSREMAEALKSAGAKVDFVEYPEEGHDCWERVFGGVGHKALR